MFRRLLFLQEGELERLAPFFGFYFFLFLMLNIGDGLSLSLFVHQVGANQLPAFYGITAWLNFLMIGLYMIWGNRLENLTLFQLIIGGSMAGFLGVWILIAGLNVQIPGIYGLFFVFRELSFAMVLLHFATFFQDYFSRDELTRVLPLVYAGGRFGGVAGGLVLATLSSVIGLINLVLVYILLGALCLVLLSKLHRTQSRHPEENDETTEATVGIQKTASRLAVLLRPPSLLFWISINSILFIMFRWVLNLQYNLYFEKAFPSEEAMAAFLGWYIAIAQFLSLLIQLFLINRLIAWIGTKGCHVLFGMIILGTAWMNLSFHSMTTAIVSRLVETELRIGIRNPVGMLLRAFFPRPDRKLSRAWSMGIIVPIATLISSCLLGGVVSGNQAAWVPIIGVVIAIAHGLSLVGLLPSYEEKSLLFKK